MTEEWRPVVGFPDYEVSNLGALRRATDAFWYPRGVKTIRARAGTIVRGRLMQGYPVALFPVGHPSLRKFKNKRIHILVCEAFHGPSPSPRHEVAHWDGNPGNLRADNLRWATRLENMQDKIRHGRTDRGARARSVKLSEDEVRRLRVMMADGCPLRETARAYGVTYQALQEIRAGRNWGWLV